MGNGRPRLPLAFLATVVAAGAATLILRPHSGLIDPVAVDAQAYFSPAQIERARHFADPQRLIGLAQIALSGITLAVLALRPPAPLELLLARIERRPLLGGALAGAAISLALAIVGLPLSIWAHARAVDVGLSTQTLGPWLVDVAKSAAIGAVLAALAGFLVMALIRRFSRRWWIPAAAVVAVFAVIGSYLWPVVVDPLFNRFEPLPRGALRSEVLQLAKRSGVDVGQVYRVDASRRTSAINAYVVGIGHTKRVVLYDNLIDRYPRDQVRSVVAHELGHVAGNDEPRGLLFVFIVAPAGMLLAQRLAERVSRGTLRAPPGDRPGPAALPAVALSVGLVAFALTCAGNALSRPVEAHADSFGLRLTGDPKAFIALERSLALRNLGDPDPPSLFQAVFGTHPTTVQRIGVGKAWEQGRR